jgi:tetratricopeptide (TPR) repeat protein
MKLIQFVLLFGPSRKSLLPLLFLMELSAVVQAQDIGFRERPNLDWKVEVSGTTGTPIVVGYKTDRSRTETFRGVVPTNFTVRASSNLYCAVKNVGSTAAPLGLQVDDATLPRIFDESSSPHILYPPFYGFTFQVETHDGGWGSGPGPTLSPTDWPETLPPGMTGRQAAKHDFTKELHQARVRAYESMVAKGQAGVWQLLWLAQAHQALTNCAGAEAAYAKLFVADCKDTMFLNNTIYDYVQNGGTNLNRAYEAALKAQNLAPNDRPNGPYIAPFITDTVGWILIKQGYYQQGLAVLQPLGQLREPQATVGVAFHRAMAHYMLMEEDRAQEKLQKVIQAPIDVPEKGEAKQCLEVLGIKEHTPQSNLVAKLEARLAKVPDDPVALSRLAGMYEQTDKVPKDALVTKALGFEAYRRGEYARAVQYLTKSAKDRPGDGELFFRFGMAYHQLGNQDEAAQWLRKATLLKLKDASVEEARRVLGWATPTNAPAGVGPHPT